MYFYDANQKKFQKISKKMDMYRNFILTPLILSLFISILLIYNLNSCNKHKIFLNLSTDVQYVGKESCRKCHEDIYQEFIKSGMGHSFYKPGTYPWIENFNNAIVYDSISNLYYQPFIIQNELFIKEFRLEKSKDTVFSHIWKIDWIIGSGRQTRSYIVEKNGFLYEAPITWYSTKKIWDLSPGYHDGLNSGFRRPLGEECIHCHNGYSSFSQGSINHFKSIAQSIDCERCHGPGEIHVTNMEKDIIVDVGKGEIDYSIVNPKHLDISKQLDVCQQCHLQGIVVNNHSKRFQDFRPGMNIQDVFNVFTVENYTNQEFGIASHAERLKKSKCFQKSKMVCTTCHNPHHPTDLNLALQSCLNCHSEPHQTQCSLKKDPKIKQNCVQCHLNKSGTSDIPHVQFTDHYIRILSKDNQKRLTPAQKKEIMLFCQTQSNPSADLKARSYWNYYETRNANPIYIDTIQKYQFQTPSLEAAKYYIYQNQLEMAFRVLQNFQPLNLQEKIWQAILLAEVYEKQKNENKAIEYYEKAYQLQPFQYRTKLKAILLKLKNSDGSILHLETALKELKILYEKNPLDYFVVLNIGKIYNDLMNSELSEKFLEEALKIYPNSIDALLELDQRQRNTLKAQKIRQRILQTEKIKDKVS